jgi:hypothetical protein
LLKGFVAMKHYALLFAAVFASLCLVAVDVRGSTITVSDDFATSHNYLTDGVTGTIWDGILNSSNATTIDANTSNSGNLTLALNAANSGWDATHTNAPFLYKTVDLNSDFTAVVKTTSVAASNYDTVGLMLYKNATNFVGINDTYTGVGIQMRSVTSGIETHSVSTGNHVAFLEFTWTASSHTATLLSSTDGTTWATMSSVVRTDIMGTADIGIYFGDYAVTTSGTRVAAIDSFSLTSVPEPATAALLAGGLLGLLACAWRKRKN